MKFLLYKKLLTGTLMMTAIPALIVPTIQIPANIKTKCNKSVEILPGDKSPSNDVEQKSNSNNLNNESASVTYDLVSTKKHGLDCGDERRYWQFLYWEAADQGSDTSFEEVRWCEPNRLLLRTEGHNNNERFIYQQIRVNINVPAHTKDYNVSFQGEVYEWFNWNCFVFGSRYQSAIQMFDLGDDINNHPDRFNNYAINKNDVDPRSILEHGWDEVGAGSKESVDVFTSKLLNWTFNNETDTPKTFNKYIGVSYWVGAQESWKNGAVKGDIKIGLRTSIDSIGEIAHSLQKWGDIRVECRLTNADDSCYITKYVDGEGTILIPDYVTFAGKNYYVREIPSNWSNGENDITGLKFAKDCTHLKKICDGAFQGTNALQYYKYNKDELLEFPEGLEEIGDHAFENCDVWTKQTIRGYSFPSTLKEIKGNDAFTESSLIEEIRFQSEVKFNVLTFYVGNKQLHQVKYLYAATYELAREIANYIRLQQNDPLLPINNNDNYNYAENPIKQSVEIAAFRTDDGYLLPKAL